MTMQPLSLLLLIAAASTAAAAEQGPVLASETVGESVHNGRAIKVYGGQEVDSGSHLARLNLKNDAKGFILLGTDTSVKLAQSVTPQGKPDLLITLLSGRVEVSLDKRGPYADVHVLGASTDTRVVGTLFIVDRMAHDQDYVAVMHGHVAVSMRNTVNGAIAGNSRDHADLTDHQGVLGGPGGISAATDELTNRPQLSGSTKPVQTQATTPSVGGGDWTHDIALSTINSEIAAIASASFSVSDTVSGTVSQQVAKTITTQITTEVVNQTVGAGTTFGAPPSPP